MPPKKDTTSNAVASSVAWIKDRTASRLSGKTASDALKNGNNAGMVYKKEAKAATTVQGQLQALQKLRIAEKESDLLREYGRKI